ncbi:hypothetical protein ACQPXS_03185 [Streptomyces sp. CA-142005]|uniref:hypothetical protein n=1 Tax=Streptomyces sp. CA-142005 TaxID=3240052 RepID=UPI003D8C8D43
MAREVAADVQGVIVPGGGHWTPEENPGFLLERLPAFPAASWIRAARHEQRS